MTKAKRRSMTKKLVASTALVGGALSLAFGGAFATFTDTVSAGPTTISSGTIEIGVGPTNASTTGAADIVPGDTMQREIDINSTGATANAAQVTLAVSATTSSLLDTDATNGLQISAQSCATKPTAAGGGGGVPLTYTCAGAWTTVDIAGRASIAIATLETTPGALTPLNSLTPNKQDYVVFTLSLPVTSPGDLSQKAACSGVAGGSVATENLEGCNSVLKYTLVATQRAGASQ